ncbi:hypothetical protein HYH03_011806 [Edaphochlamys debaryana]|uniref:Guanylate cyclase domain-containing protein n=1 Tax=Edaphochlamys debaryana TaxID=47281 RepID=A0A835XU30_9CHLO|nr:hypothetical protein HYH03_011806 [Edaphochlamys debaryana]|eukprot:KAG2489697.1 hypothetical protein HYH03_011806 [Edaphochlamys debaryana]
MPWSASQSAEKRGRWPVVTRNEGGGLATGRVLGTLLLTLSPVPGTGHGTPAHERTQAYPGLSPENGLHPLQHRLSAAGAGGLNCLAYDALPLAVTIFAVDGSIRHQNAASCAYYGRRTGSAGKLASATAAAWPLRGEGEGGGEPSLLRQLFAVDPCKLEDMLGRTLGATAAQGGVWEGIVRVPASLNPAGPSSVASGASRATAGPRGQAAAVQGPESTAPRNAPAASSTSAATAFANSPVRAAAADGLLSRADTAGSDTGRLWVQLPASGALPCEQPPVTTPLPRAPLTRHCSTASSFNAGSEAPAAREPSTLGRSSTALRLLRAATGPLRRRMSAVASANVASVGDTSSGKDAAAGSEAEAGVVSLSSSCRVASKASTGSRVAAFVNAVLDATPTREACGSLGTTPSGTATTSGGGGGSGGGAFDKRSAAGASTGASAGTTRRLRLQIRRKSLLGLFGSGASGTSGVVPTGPGGGDGSASGTVNFGAKADETSGAAAAAGGATPSFAACTPAPEASASQPASTSVTAPTGSDGSGHRQPAPTSAATDAAAAQQPPTPAGTDAGPSAGCSEAVGVLLGTGSVESRSGGSHKDQQQRKAFAGASFRSRFSSVNPFATSSWAVMYDNLSTAPSDALAAAGASNAPPTLLLAEALGSSAGRPDSSLLTSRPFSARGAHPAPVVPTPSNSASRGVHRRASAHANLGAAPGPRCTDAMESATAAGSEDPASAAVRDRAPARALLGARRTSLELRWEEHVEPKPGRGEAAPAARCDGHPEPRTRVDVGGGTAWPADASAEAGMASSSTAPATATADSAPAAGTADAPAEHQLAARSVSSPQTSVNPDSEEGANTDKLRPLRSEVIALRLASLRAPSQPRGIPGQGPHPSWVGGYGGLACAQPSPHTATFAHGEHQKQPLLPSPLDASGDRELPSSVTSPYGSPHSTAFSLPRGAPGLRCASLPSVLGVLPRSTLAAAAQAGATPAHPAPGHVDLYRATSVNTRQRSFRCCPPAAGTSPRTAGSGTSGAQTVTGTGTVTPDLSTSIKAGLCSNAGARSQPQGPGGAACSSRVLAFASSLKGAPRRRASGSVGDSTRAPRALLMRGGGPGSAAPTNTRTAPTSVVGSPVSGVDVSVHGPARPLHVGVAAIAGSNALQSAAANVDDGDGNESVTVISLRRSIMGSPSSQTDLGSCPPPALAAGEARGDAGLMAVGAGVFAATLLDASHHSVASLAPSTLTSVVADSTVLNVTASRKGTGGEVGSQGVSGMLRNLRLNLTLSGSDSAAARTEDRYATARRTSGARTPGLSSFTIPRLYGSAADDGGTSHSGLPSGLMSSSATPNAGGTTSVIEEETEEAHRSQGSRSGTQEQGPESTAGRHQQSAAEVEPVVSTVQVTGGGEDGAAPQAPAPEFEACAAGLAWHEVRASAVEDPGSGARYLVVVQKDVTAKVEAERHIAQVSEAEHRLLEQIFPRHVLAYMTEEAFSPAQPEPPAPQPTSAELGPIAAAASPGASATAAAHSLPSPATAHLTWRPYVRDCTELATWHPEVTVLFADIQGFTPMCKQLPPTVVMQFLNDLFVRFDAMLDAYGVYKVETIGDCYVVAGGLITEDADGMAAVQEAGADPQQADRVFAFARAMLRSASCVRMPTTGEAVKIRVGIHSGPVVSGVVGTRMPRFCLFGDTINTASRMESTSKPGCVHVSSDTYALLSARDAGWAPTGGLEVKGKGHMETYLWGPSDGATLAIAESVIARRGGLHGNGNGNGSSSTEAADPHPHPDPRTTGPAGPAPRVGLLVNDLASLNVDSQLLALPPALTLPAPAAAPPAAEMVELSNGCVCCNLRGELQMQLRKMLTQPDPPLDHVLVEATGVGEPAKLAAAVAALEAEGGGGGGDSGAGSGGGGRLVLARVVTVVDVSSLLRLLMNPSAPAPEPEPASFSGWGTINPRPSSEAAGAAGAGPGPAGLAAGAASTGATAGAGGEPEPERSLARLLVQQIEGADVVLLNKCDRLLACVRQELEQETDQGVGQAPRPEPGRGQGQEQGQPAEAEAGAEAQRRGSASGSEGQPGDAVAREDSFPGFQPHIVPAVQLQPPHPPPSWPPLSSAPADDTPTPTPASTSAAAAPPPTANCGGGQEAPDADGAEAAAARELKRVAAVVRRLNPGARVVPCERCRVPLDLILGGTGGEEEEGGAAAGRHVAAPSAEEGAGAGAGAMEEVEGSGAAGRAHEEEEYGIGTLVYRSRRPFHPQRLWVLLRVLAAGPRGGPVEAGAAAPAVGAAGADASGAGGGGGGSGAGLPYEPPQALLRAKGLFWVASLPQAIWELSLSGGELELAAAGRWLCSMVDRDSWPLGDSRGRRRRRRLHAAAASGAGTGGAAAAAEAPDCGDEAMEVEAEAGAAEGEGSDPADDGSDWSEVGSEVEEGGGERNGHGAAGRGPGPTGSTAAGGADVSSGLAEARKAKRRRLRWHRRWGDRRCGLVFIGVGLGLGGSSGGEAAGAERAGAADGRREATMAEAGMSTAGADGSDGGAEAGVAPLTAAQRLEACLRWAQVTAAEEAEGEEAWAAWEDAEWLGLLESSGAGTHHDREAAHALAAKAASEQSEGAAEAPDRKDGQEGTASEEPEATPEVTPDLAPVEPTLHTPAPASSASSSRGSAPSSSGTSGTSSSSGGSILPLALAAVAVIGGIAFALMRRRGGASGSASGSGPAAATKRSAKAPRKAGANAGAATGAAAAEPAPPPEPEPEPIEPDTLDILVCAVPDGAASPAAAAAGSLPLPLAGVTIVVSEDIDVAGTPTTLGVPGAPPLAEADDVTASAAAVVKLAAAGALVVGKSSMQPLGMDTVGANYGNPYNKAHVAGGGHTGSAAAVATGLSRAALCSDLLGSSRLPAACCGLYCYTSTPGALGHANAAAASAAAAATAAAASAAAASAAATGAAAVGPAAPEAHLGSLAVMASDPGVMMKVAQALGAPGSYNLRGELVRFVVAEDLFAACAVEYQPAALAVKRAILKWAGSEQAGAVQLCRFLADNSGGWSGIEPDPLLADIGGLPPGLTAWTTAARELALAHLRALLPTSAAEAEAAKAVEEKEAGAEEREEEAGAEDDGEEGAKPEAGAETGAGKEGAEAEGHEGKEEGTSAVAAAEERAANGDAASADAAPSAAAAAADADASSAADGASFSAPRHPRLPAAPPAARIEALREAARQLYDTLRHTVKPDTVIVLPVVPAAPLKRRNVSAAAGAAYGPAGLTPESAAWEALSHCFAAVPALAQCPVVVVPLGTVADGTPLAAALMGCAKFDARLLAVAAKMGPLMQEAFEGVKQGLADHVRKQQEAEAGGAAAGAASAAAAGAAAAAAGGKGAAAAAAAGGKGAAALAPAAPAAAAAPAAPPVDPRRAERAERFKAKGNEFFKVGRFAEALTEYGRAINENPENPVYYNNRAMACLKIFRFEQAEEDCNRALRFDLKEADKAKALLRRATARTALQKYTEAEKDLRQVLAVEPNNRQAREDLQHLQQMKTDMAAAQQRMVADFQQQRAMAAASGAAGGASAAAGGGSGRGAAGGLPGMGMLPPGFDPSQLPPGMDPQALMQMLSQGGGGDMAGFGPMFGGGGGGR